MDAFAHMRPFLHRLTTTVSTRERMCRGCEDIKPLDQFYSSTSGASGNRRYHYFCKDCDKQRIRESRRG
jgi:hypothetical protein